MYNSANVANETTICKLTEYRHCFYKGFMTHRLLLGACKVLQIHQKHFKLQSFYVILTTQEIHYYRCL